MYWSDWDSYTLKQKKFQIDKGLKIKKLKVLDEVIRLRLKS